MRERERERQRAGIAREAVIAREGGVGPRRAARALVRAFAEFRPAERGDRDDAAHGGPAVERRLRALQDLDAADAGGREASEILELPRRRRGVGHQDAVDEDRDVAASGPADPEIGEGAGGAVLDERDAGQPREIVGELDVPGGAEIVLRHHDDRGAGAFAFYGRGVGRDHDLVEQERVLGRADAWREGQRGGAGEQSGPGHLMSFPRGPFRAHVTDVVGEVRSPADGDRCHHYGKPLPAARPAPGQGDHSGRSPDSRVIAWTGLPRVHVAPQWHCRPGSPLTVAGAVADSGALPLTAFPFHRTADRPNRSPFLVNLTVGAVKFLNDVSALRRGAAEGSCGVRGRALGRGSDPQGGTSMDDMADPKPDSYRVTAEELRQFIERWERLEAEKRDIADQQKEVMAEAKGRGYDTKVMRKVIALRKREPDDIAEEEAVLEMYKQALGMP
jgi:uncharacterized protein (UPF0335 family)